VNSTVGLYNQNPCPAKLNLLALVYGVTTRSICIAKEA
jgi:hypothetical protein